jgi:hypothetical protein
VQPPTGTEKGDLEVEQDEQDGDEVVAHVELHAGVLEGFEAALVRVSSSAASGRLWTPMTLEMTQPRSWGDYADTDADEDEQEDRKVLNRGSSGAVLPLATWQKNLPDAVPGRLLYLVPSARLELAQLSPLPPQDSVSTNFTTTAVRARAGKASRKSPLCEEKRMPSRATVELYS